MIKSNQEMQSLINSDVLALVNIQPTEKSYTGNYIGKVIVNLDPDMLGRCKIRVLGVFDTVEDEYLPWADPDFDFVGSLKGSFIVPPVGCIVSVYFENDDLYFPKYTRKVVDKANLPKNHSKNYPNTMVFFETDNGTSFEIDRTTDEVTLNHKAGSKIIIKPNGEIHLGGDELVQRLIDQRITTALDTHTHSIVGNATGVPVVLFGPLLDDFSTQITRAK